MVDLTKTGLEPEFMDMAFRYALAGEVEGAVIASGITMTVAFDRNKLVEVRPAIVKCIKLLPDSFLTGCGGGMSFLGLCHDRENRLWTGMHHSMEQLCLLAIGLGIGRWCLDRKFWPALPGGVPYVQFDLEG